MKAVDVAIIGAGTAGLAAYRAARAEGATTAIIEGGAYGTTCARVGCMPSKLLIAAAEAAHAVAAAPGFGVHIDGVVRVNGIAVMERVRRERDRFVDYVLRDMERIPETDRIRGHASFVDDHTLDVGDEGRLSARCVVIATGSRPTRPESLTTLGDGLIVSDDVFDWPDLPSSVGVIGPGIVGLELGQALHRLGVRVAIFGRGGRVGPIGDPEVLAYAITAFRQEFILEPDAHIEETRRNGDAIHVRRTGEDGARTSESFDLLLAATGRTPNVQALCLERTTLALDSNGVPTYDHETTQATCSHGNGDRAGIPLFVAGDAGNFIPLLHEAADEGRIAGTNAARLAQGKPVQPGRRRARIGVMFTDPQIAVVGGGFRALAPGAFVTGQVNFEGQGRARILRRNKGLMNIYADAKTARLLGAELAAPGGEHLAHLLAWALQNRMTIGQMLAMPYYHPVLEEGLRTALRHVSANLRAAGYTGDRTA